MKESQSYRVSNNTHRFSEAPIEEQELYYWTEITQNSDNLIGSAKESQEIHLTNELFEQYCTLESSSGTGSYPVQNSSSSVSFSPNGSPSSQPETQSNLIDPNRSPENACASPVSHSCLTDEADDLRHKIRELETAMLGTDPEIPDMLNLSTRQNETSLEEENWKEIMEMVSRTDLKGLLCACARALDSNDILRAEWLISELRQMVSVSGDPLQRIGAYMVEGLVARLAMSGSSIYKALRCKDPAGPELLSYMHLLYEICPYFKFGYMSANGAIAEAVKDEPTIHIIDFQIVQGAQWLTLIHALATRPGGPPRVRITGIDDPTSAAARGSGLAVVGARLTRVAEACKVPFEFNPVEVHGAEIRAEDLRVRPGEAVAVNFAMMLHHMPDESVAGARNHRDRILRLAKGLAPRVVTLVEQESNTNTAPFLARFAETMRYYSAVFESIDAALPREHKERISVEQHCLARDIVNLIACEGADRVERHEPLGKWRARFTMAGFRPYPLSPLVNATIKALLRNYSEKFTLEERDGALFLGWMDKALVASSAWR